MTDRHADSLYRRVVKGEELTAKDRAHIADCVACQQAVAEASHLDQRLTSAARLLATEPMPEGLAAVESPSRRNVLLQLAALAVTAGVAGIAVAIGTGAIGPTPGESPNAVASESPATTASGPTPLEASPSATLPATPEPVHVDGLVIGPYGCGDGTVAFNVWIPAGWFANPATALQPACRLVNVEPFDPQEVTASTDTPIRLDVESGDFMPAGEVLERREKQIGDRPALRMVVRDEGGQHLYYLVGLDNRLPPSDGSDRVLVGYTTQGDQTFDRDSMALDELFSRFSVADPITEPSEVTAEADALFASTSTCRNPNVPFPIVYPRSWFTNEATSESPECTWFGPSPINRSADGEVPRDAAIELTVINGAFGSFETVFSFESRSVAGYPAQRTESFGGTAGEPDRSQRTLRYVVQLDRDIVGRSLLGATSTQMAGDYELAKAVLDRMLVGLATH